MEKLSMKRMGRNWLLTISILCLSCINNQSSELLIPREEFKDILIDLHNSQSDSVFINKAINQELYKKTIFFYSENPKLMLSILGEVQDSLTLITTDL